MTELQSIWITSRQELADAIRSRRAAVILILYLAGSLLACNGFVTVLHKLEVQLADMLKISAGASPGVVMGALWENHEFQRMVRHLVGDAEVARQLLSVPPLALVYGWLAFTFTPILVMLSASGRIAEETASNSVRFVIVRSSRMAWVLGKFTGQALLLILALLLSAVGAWCIGRFRLTGFAQGPAAAAMMIYAAKAWIYSLVFVGLALGLSQLTRRPYLSMALGFLTWLGTTFLALAAGHYLKQDGGSPAWELLRQMLPQGHRLDLWRTDAPHLVVAILFLTSLAFVYLFAGFAWFRRRDL